MELVCVTCHNERDREHRQLINQATYVAKLDAKQSTQTTNAHGYSFENLVEAHRTKNSKRKKLFNSSNPIDNAMHATSVSSTDLLSYRG
jgi:hypothetical protein